MIGALPAKRKEWTLRRSDEVVLQIWRVIANAGPRGIKPAELRERLNGIEHDLLKSLLQELRRKGLAQLVGLKQWGTWVATGKLPPDEAALPWMHDDPECTVAPHTASTKADQVLAEARTVANSVFGLGEQLAGFGVDIDAVHMPDEHKAAMAAPADPVLASALSLDHPAQEVPGDEVPYADPAQAPAQQAEAEADMAARGHFSLFTPAEGPLFALRSDHRLLMLRQSGDELLFSPDETRALFRYLDNLMAIGHGSLSEAAA